MSPGAAALPGTPRTMAPFEMSARGHRALIGLTVGVAASAFFLWLAIRGADLEHVRSLLEQARGRLVGLAVGAFACFYVVQAARWRAIAATPDTSIARFAGLVIQGAACNNVLPIRLGDLLRARWLGRDAAIPSGRALGTVVLDRGCDLAILVVLLLIGIAVIASSGWLVSLAVAAALGLAGLGAALLFSRMYVERKARERRARGFVRRVLRDVIETLAQPFDRRSAAAWLGLSAVAWTIWAAAAVIVAEALSIRLSLGDALFVAAVMNLGSTIPSSPGYVGTYEWLGVASLGVLGVAKSEALAFSILLHATWYVPSTFAGLTMLGARWLRHTRRARD